MNSYGFWSLTSTSQVRADATRSTRGRQDIGSNEIIHATTGTPTSCTPNGRDDTADMQRKDHKDPRNPYDF